MKELDVFIAERSKQSLVTHIAHAVQRKFRLPFLEQNGLDVDPVGFRRAPIVIDKSCRLQDI